MASNMKKILYILAAVATLSMTSCDDLLEEQNYGNPTIEDMMTNEENVTLLVGQAYADLKWMHDHWGYWGVNLLTSDEGVCPVRYPEEHWSDGGYWRSLNTHTWDYHGDALKNIWNTTIAGAVLCNSLIKTLNDYKDSMSESVYLQYIGETEVLRSYYYYLLFDCFGRIPYLEEYADKTEPLMEPEDVWSHLVACLERNAPNMAVVTDANRSQHYGRVTQGFAYALLARLYLNAESFGCDQTNVFKNVEKPATYTEDSFYTNCIRCCDEVIKSGSYRIEADYFANFLIDNSNSKENIFVIVEDGNADFDARSNGSMSNKLRMLHLSLPYVKTADGGWSTMKEDGWNGFVARPEFLALYNERDVRGPGNEGMGTANKNRWGWLVGPVYDMKNEKILKDKFGNPWDITPELEIYTDENGANPYGTDPLRATTWQSGARMFKYELDREGLYTWAENDFVLMRYADVLWMKEEASQRGGAGGGAQGLPDFQTMLKRAFAYDKGAASFTEAYGAISLDMILDERGREFAWELVRRRDLIRFEEFDNVQYVTKKSAHLKWFPIPYSVLEKSKIDENGNKYWTQNPGYVSTGL